MSVSIQNLRCKINASFELKIDELKAKPGEILGISGQNGSGKSSLFEVILGNISFEGKVQSKETAIVFQESDVFTHLTISDNITIGLDDKNDDTLKEMLSLFDLEEFQSKKASSLSGGEAQRLAIARSLALHLPILLLDESFNQMDEKTKKELLPRLRNYLKINNITSLLICHNFEDIECFCDSVAILKQGRLAYHSLIENKSDLSKAKELI